MELGPVIHYMYDPTLSIMRHVPHVNEINLQNYNKVKPKPFDTIGTYLYMRE